MNWLRRLRAWILLLVDAAPSFQTAEHRSDEVVDSLSDVTRNDGREFVWCAVANGIAERPYGPGGLLRRSGTKHFRPGAKVHVRGVYWGMGGESLEVVAHHRGSGRLVAMVIRSEWLTNWRVKRIFEPGVVARLRAAPGTTGTTRHGEAFCRWDDSDDSYRRAEEIVKAFTRA